MPFEYKALDPNKRRPLTTGEHLQLLANPAQARVGIVADDLSRPGGTPPSSFGVPVTGGAPAGATSPMGAAMAPLQNFPARGAAGQESAATGGAQAAIQAPQAPDYSQLMMNPADNPHGEQRPEVDPRSDRRRMIAQLAGAGVGALGMLFENEGLAHAGAGFAQGVGDARTADQQRIAEQQEAWSQWL